MTIQFACHGCRNPFQVPDSMAGVGARCNRCGTIVTVPRPAPAAAAYAPVAAAPTPWAPQPARRLSPGLLVGVGAGVTVVIALGLLVVERLIFARPPKPVATTDGPGTTPPVGGESSPPSADVPSVIPAPRSSAPAPWSRPTEPKGKGVDLSPKSDAGASGSDPFSKSGSAPSDRGDDRKTTTDDKAWSSKSLPRPAWAGESSDLRIPVDKTDVVTFGPPGCPVVVVSNDVWDLTTNRKIATLEDAGDRARDFDRRAALSADGRRYALATNNSKKDVRTIGVWDTASGRRLHEIAAKAGQAVDILFFSREKYLGVGSGFSGILQVWDVESGESAKNVVLPKTIFHTEEFTMSRDGQHFAARADGGALAVFKTSTSKPVVAMSLESLGDPGVGDALGGLPADLLPDARTKRGAGEKARRDPMPLGTDRVRFRALAFSPDGQELAGVANLNHVSKLICWNNRGEVVWESSFAFHSQFVSRGLVLEWLPDGSGWYFAGRLIDRTSRRCVASARRGFGYYRVLDRDRLIGVFPFQPDEVQVVRIPWDRLKESLKGLEDEVPAHLAPGKTVAITIELNGLRGDYQETFRRLGEALTRRLARDGISVALGRETVFRIRFDESAGDSLRIVEQASRFGGRRETGRTATEAKGRMVVELMVPGSAEPIWSDEISGSNASWLSEQITDGSVRSSMLRAVEDSIQDLHVPYFIPESPDLLPLPLWLD